MVGTAVDRWIIDSVQFTAREQRFDFPIADAGKQQLLCLAQIDFCLPGLVRDDVCVPVCPGDCPSALYANLTAARHRLSPR